MIIDVEINRFEFEELEVGDAFEADWSVYMKIRPIEDKNNKRILGNCVNLETAKVTIMPEERNVRLIKNCRLTNIGGKKMRYLRLILESSDNIIPFEDYTLRCVGKTLYINPITDTHAYMIDYSTADEASEEMYWITEWLNDDESPTVYEINRTVMVERL